MNVQVVFCVDTEGPCADPDNPELLGSWEQVDAAMAKLFDPAFRSRFPDPVGGQLRVGWFFLTWTGFRTNLRGRDFGYHRVRNHYLERFGADLEACGDEQCWHYHHPPASGVGNEWGLDWTLGDEHDAIVSRQLLEREWFPVCFRAGGTIMDPLSSRWIDRWFPFDYSNRAPLELPGLVDWSSGVAEWSLYHPDPEDFRRPGPGRRRMARCLDLVTDVHVLSEGDVEQAFAQARDGRPAVLACFDHDYRDIADRVDGFRELVHAVAARYPDVPWRYAAPVEAARGALGTPRPRRLELDAAVAGGAVHVWASEPLFQSIPWLALRTPEGEVLHVEEELLRLDETRWIWRPQAEWVEIAFGGSTDLGESAVARITPADGPGALFLRRRTTTSPTRPRSIWDHSKYFVELCVDRASGRAPEMDAALQAADYLAERLRPGMSVLDVGCAAGHLHRSIAGLRVEYHGIDISGRAIEIGRRYGADEGLPASRLRELAIEDLPPEERHDAVVCLSTLLYLPDFRLPLEVMARAARCWLVVRSSFGERTEIRYVPDVWLEPGFQAIRTYVNMFSREEVQEFLEREGFAVTWEEDRRQRERFSGRPEIVAGLPISYEFLLAERVAPPPTEEELLGDELGAVAREWRELRRPR